MAESQSTTGRTFRRVCQNCHQPYVGLSNRRRNCPACCKCQRCGAQMSDSKRRFCGNSCAAKWRAARFPNKGRFKSGRRATYSRVCDTCGEMFAATTATRKRCPDCCKCKECGRQLKNASHKFCSQLCAGAWRYRNCDSIQRNLKVGQLLPKKSWGALKGRPAPWHRGANNPNWKGGRGQERHTAMGRVEYKIWRATVFKRDGYACVACGAKHPLEANHIRRWSEHAELRYDPDNGVTMCEDCHKSIYGVEEQFIDRFVDYVRKRKPLELSEQEKLRFEPVIAPCNFCGKELRKPRSQRSYRFHFCNVGCRKAHEKTPSYRAYLSRRMKDFHATSS